MQAPRYSGACCYVALSSVGSFSFTHSVLAQLHQGLAVSSTPEGEAWVTPLSPLRLPQLDPSPCSFFPSACYSATLHGSGDPTVSGAFVLPLPFNSPKNVDFLCLLQEMKTHI